MIKRSFVITSLCVLAGGSHTEQRHVSTEVEIMPHEHAKSFAETGPNRNTKFQSRKNAFALQSVESKKPQVLPGRHPEAKLQPHHFVDDGLAVAATEGSQFLGSWSTSEWGGCQVNCGTGLRYRVVTCVDSAGNEISESQCDLSVKPTASQSCEGDCSKCDVNAQFLKGMGASSLITKPVKVPLDTTDVMCRVTSAFSCCSQAVEQQVLISHYQLRRGLKSLTQRRDTNVDRVNKVYANISSVLSSRIDETSSAFDLVSTAVEDSADMKTSDNESLDLLRQSVLSVLNSRLDALSTAQSDVAVAQSELLEQMDLMNSLPDDDVEPEDDLSAANNTVSGSFLADLTGGWFSESSTAYQTANFDDSDLGSLSLVKQHTMNKPYSLLQTELMNFTDPKLRVFSKACQESVSDYFVSLACSSCNPSYPILGRAAPEQPVVRVPSATCSNLYSQCADTLGEAHQHMTEAIRALLNSHANLITLINQVQPILDRVWVELRFDWLPGFSSMQVAKPDLTKMQCIQDLKVFNPYVVSNSTDFCNAYFTFASPRAFLKRISNQLDRGLFAMGKFTSCDRCLHNTLLFLADVLGPQAKGSLRLTLPTKAQAMLSSCGAQPPAAPLPAGAPAQLARMTMEERISPRVRFGLPVESIKGFSFYVNVSQEIVDAASDAAPHEWKMRTLKLETPLNGSEIRRVPVSRDTLKEGGPDAALQIHVMNMNCTKHSECALQDAPSGMRPWWYCAHPNVCFLQPGACTAEGEALLATGPKCVRGTCGSDMSAADKSCPVNAICPAQIGSLADKPRPFFGEQYFSKFDLKIRDDDPLSGARGVCDCAFAPNGAVTDRCMYARCLAYASMLESTMTCNTGLVAQCLEIKLGVDECKNDDTLSCTVKDIILTYPPDVPGECRVNNFALADQTKDFSIESLWSLLLVVLVVVL